MADPLTEAEDAAKYLLEALDIATGWSAKLPDRYGDNVRDHLERAKWILRHVSNHVARAAETADLARGCNEHHRRAEVSTDRYERRP